MKTQQQTYYGYFAVSSCNTLNFGIKASLSVRKVAKGPRMARGPLMLLATGLSV